MSENATANPDTDREAALATLRDLASSEKVSHEMRLQAASQLIWSTDGPNTDGVPTDVVTEIADKVAARLLADIAAPPQSASDPEPGVAGGDERPVSFASELEDLINRHSLENGSNTPDFILANFLISALLVFDETVQRREAWYGRNDHPADGGQATDGGEAVAQSAGECDEGPRDDLGRYVTEIEFDNGAKLRTHQDRLSVCDLLERATRDGIEFVYIDPPNFVAHTADQQVAIRPSLVVMVRRVERD